MSRRVESIEHESGQFPEGPDLEALRANLALSPAQRFADLVAMNRFHADVQSRTLPPWLQAALDGAEIDAALRRLEEAGG